MRDWHPSPTLPPGRNSQATFATTAVRSPSQGRVLPGAIALPKP
ncbi:MAG: hypothetical protein ACRC8Y_06165 [Chroococcales cyanobacterium]